MNNKQTVLTFLRNPHQKVGKPGILKIHIKPLLQIPIILFLALLHSVYVHAQTVQLDFDPNVFQIVVTPDSDLIGWYDANKYGQDFSIPNTNAPGVYACSAYCPQAALDAGAVYYKEFQVAGHGTVIVYYDANGNIVGTGRDLDGDGSGDSFDTDADGDGVNDTYDAFPYDPYRSSSQVGAVAGQLSVSPGGAANYSIPIALPPGIAGVQPQLTLSYHSQSGNGMVGIGWSLGGLSAITRCPTTRAVDGYIDGVDLDSNDKFCLDGQRLVVVPGTGSYGANGTEYRTRIDGFSRIISYGASGNGPAYFKVWTKAGDMMEYGLTADAKAKVPNKPEVLTWALNKVSDVYGNHFDVYYTNNAGNGEQTPDRIEYAGHIIQFSYATRSDPSTHYFAGQAMGMSKLLTQISTPAFNYILNYQQTGLAKRNRLSSVLHCDKNNQCLPPIRVGWLASGTGFSGSSNPYSQSLPNTYLAVDDGDHTEDRGVQLVDINGDGLQDIFQSYLDDNNVASKSVYLNNGAQFSHHAGYSNSIPAQFYFSKKDGDDGGGRVIDINGDGLNDLVYSGTTTNCLEWDAENNRWLPPGCTTSTEKLMVYINTGSAWSYADSYDNASVKMLLDGKDSGVRFADFNGDNLVDIIQLWYPHVDFYGGNPKRDVYLNTGNGFSHDPVFSNSLANTLIYFAGRTDGKHHDLGTRIADVNGDGLQDLIQIFNSAYSGKYDGGYIKWVYLNTGTQFSNDATFTASLPNTDFAAGARTRKSSYSHHNFTVNHGTELIDLNNDGLLDLIQAWEVSDTERYHTAYLNTGKHFQINTAYAPPSDMPFRINIPGQQGVTKSGGTVFTDINNDGLIDLVRLVRHRKGPLLVLPDVHRYVYLNNGSGFETQRSLGYENALPADIYFADEYDVGGDHAGTGAMFADINGDGSDDLVTLYYGFSNGSNYLQKNVYLNNTSNAINLINTITGSFGDTHTVTYAPLTDTSVYTKGTVDTNLNRTIHPERDLQTSLRVVKRVANTNGIGGTVSSLYRYSGLKHHLQGHGSLGFKTVSVTDEQSSVTLATEYAQHPDYAGMALRLYKTDGNGNPLSDFTNTPATLATAGNGSVFAYVSQSVEKTYDFTSNALLKTETTTTAYNGAENGGNYGNATSINVHTVNETVSGESFTLNTENRYHPPVTSSDQWILGRLYWSKATRLKNGQTDLYSERISAFEYHTNGVLKSETLLPDDAQEVLTTLKQYDTYGNITQQTVCDTVAGSCAHDSGNVRTTTTDYDTEGRFPSRITNALDQFEDHTYNTLFGVPTSLTGPNQLTTHWYYDSFGRKIREARADGTETITTYQYCYSGCAAVAGITPHYRITTTSTGAAPVTEYYDNHQRKIRVQTTGYSGQTVYTDTIYDARGRVLKTSLPYTSAETPLWTTTDYDNYSRVTAVHYPVGDINGDGNDDGPRSRHYTYNGYHKTETDAKGRSTTELSNAIGQRTRITDPAGNNTHYHYTSQGDLQKTVDPNGNEILIAYNDRGLKTATTDPDMGHWTYAYTGYGELNSQTDAKNQTTTLSYDKLGRLISRTAAEGTSTWTYGSVFNAANRNIGKLIQTRGPQDNETLSYTYDNLGRPAGATQTFNIAPYISNQSYTHSQTYDSAGRIDRIYYPQVNGQQLHIQRVYNTHGYLSQVKTADGSTVYWQGTDSNARGDITRVLLGNGLTTNYAYNHATGWLLGVTTTDTSGSAIQHSSYTFDEVGNILTRKDHRQQINGLVETFTYDSLFDRLTGSSIQNAINPNAVYNNKNYTYDSLGNLTSKDGKTYRYGNQCTGNNGGLRPHAVCEVINGTTTDIYTYDANGNLTTGGGRSVLYTSFNKPNHFIQGSQTVHFHYGATHNRIFKVANTTRTTYIDLGEEGNALFEKHEDTAAGHTDYLHFIYAAGKQAIAVHTLRNHGTGTTASTEYYHRDHLGSIEAISTATGSITPVSHDPWGKRRNPDWTDATTSLAAVTGNLGFTGHESISEIGLVHMNGRVYDPELGRFLSADPHIQFESDSQSYNRYSYVLNNPLKYTDPSGYVITELIALIMTLTGAEAVYIAITVAVAAAAETYYHTGSGSAAIKTGLVTFMTTQIATAIGEWGQGTSYTVNPQRFIAKAFLHAINGGMTSVMLGGDFKSGAVGSFAASLGEPIMFGAVSKTNTSGPAKATRTLLAAMVGGTASVLSGGKFANGALSAAVKWLFNAETSNDGEQVALQSNQGSKYKLALVAEHSNDGSSAGHVFVGGIKPDGSTEAYGFYPKGQNVDALYEGKELEGLVKNDSYKFDRALSGSKDFQMKVFTVDKSTYNLAMNYIQGYSQSGDYGLFTNSCVHAAFNTFNHVGLIHSYSTNVPAVHPNTIYDAIQQGY